MDYVKLNNIIEEFINNNKFYVDTLPIVEDYSKRVMNEKIPIVSNNYSRSIDINESIRIVYTFLESVDSRLSNRFMNILNSKDENGRPYVNILPRSQYPEGRDEVRDGRVYIYYENNPNDCFVILHEILHKMNECIIIDQKNQVAETFTRDYFGELVSILGEFLLGDYLVDNDIITKNDFNIRKKRRIDGTKENARDIIIEAELIKMKLNGKTINNDNINQLLNSLRNEPVMHIVLEDEVNDVRRTSCILKHESLNLPKSQRYVIALYLSGKLLSKESVISDFINLNNAVGDTYSDIYKVYSGIITSNNNYNNYY